MSRSENFDACQVRYLITELVCSIYRFISQNLTPPPRSKCRWSRKLRAQLRNAERNELNIQSPICIKLKCNTDHNQQRHLRPTCICNDDCPGQVTGSFCLISHKYATQNYNSSSTSRSTSISSSTDGIQHAHNNFPKSVEPDSFASMIASAKWARKSEAALASLVEREGRTDLQQSLQVSCVFSCLALKCAH